jgi:2'-5' RNA ligase
MSSPILAQSLTLLALMLPDADLVIGDLRDQHDPSAKRDLGAHITIRFDWLSANRITATDHDCIASICASTPTIVVTLARVAEFPRVVYLEPEPAAPIEALAKRIAERYPARADDHPFKPHVTVGRKLPGEDVKRIRNLASTRLVQQGNVTTSCNELTLLISRNGKWVRQRDYPFGAYYQRELLAHDKTLP